MRKNAVLTIAAISCAVLAGCQNSAEMYRSDVYTAGQVNQAQEVQTVEILAITPARVAVDNSANAQAGQTAGMVIGAIIGALVTGGGHSYHHGPARTAGAIGGGALGAVAGNAMSGGSVNYANGVQITFRQGDQVFNSAQVGRVCEYKLGLAVMVSPSPNATRIQPNNPGGCPVEPPAQ